MNITLDQITGLVRNLLMLAGGFALGHHWVSPDTVALVSGIVLAVVPVVWSAYANRAQGIVNSAAALPEVKKIVAEPTVATAAPSEKVVPHG
jgi:hypothetical protein